MMQKRIKPFRRRKHPDREHAQTPTPSVSGTSSALSTEDAQLSQSLTPFEIDIDVSTVDTTQVQKGGRSPPGTNYTIAAKNQTYVPTDPSELSSHILEGVPLIS
jgi:hypothetical protein